MNTGISLLIHIISLETQGTFLLLYEQTASITASKPSNTSNTAYFLPAVPAVPALLKFFTAAAFRAAVPVRQAKPSD